MSRYGRHQKTSLQLGMGSDQLDTEFDVVSYIMARPLVVKQEMRDNCGTYLLLHSASAVGFFGVTLAAIWATQTEGIPLLDIPLLNLHTCPALVVQNSPALGHIHTPDRL